jgi:hypothetical protein
MWDAHQTSVGEIKMATTIPVPDNDAKLREASRRGTIRVMTDDYAIVFNPSSSYYNRGRNTLSSYITIVFRKFNNWSGRELCTVEFGRDIRPTAKVIQQAVELAEKLLKTVKTAEEYVAEVGRGVILTAVNNDTHRCLSDANGTPVVFHGDVQRTELLKRIDNTTYVTTTSEHEAAIEQQEKQQAGEKKQAAITAWLGDFNAADADAQRAMVAKLIRI